MRRGNTCSHCVERHLTQLSASRREAEVHQHYFSFVLQKLDAYGSAFTSLLLIATLLLIEDNIRQKARTVIFK